MENTQQDFFLRIISLSDHFQKEREIAVTWNSCLSSAVPRPTDHVRTGHTQHRGRSAGSPLVSSPPSCRLRSLAVCHLSGLPSLLAEGQKCVGETVLASSEQVRWAASRRRLLVSQGGWDGVQKPVPIWLSGFQMVLCNSQSLLIVLSSFVYICLKSVSLKF